MKKILKWLILLVAIFILLYTINGIYRESKINKANTNQNLINDVQDITKDDNPKTSNENIEQNKKTEENTNLVAEKYKGYTVAANLKIEKLNIDTCVLEDYTKNAMNVCVTKFFGPEPNEVGNFCIVGHNYITKNMFGYLYTLEIGDTFTLTDNKHGTIEYKIYDEYKAKPTQTYRLITKNERKKRSNFSYML